MFHYRNHISLLLITLLLSACDDPVPSTSVSNSELQAKIRVTKTSSHTATVTTSLKAIISTGSEDVELDGDDHLLVSIDSELENLFTENSGGLFENTSNISTSLFELKPRQDHDHLFEFFSFDHNPEYFTILENINDNSKFFISMIRQQDTNILDSEVSLPTPFEISSPTYGETISRSQVFALNWSNTSTDNMELHIEGTCNSTETDNEIVNDTFNIGNDVGFVSFLIGNNVLILPNRLENSRCNLNLHLRRIQTGTVVTNFGSGGLAEGIQQRTISIISVP
ncbi:MAG: hypothetical protein OQK98_06780 [Gammaproteobacteria bacterium]|nr:hypothetical protein [Gammaproteobacteria bacterium]